MTKTLVPACALLAALLAVGCGGKIKYPRYHTLAVAPTPTTAVPTPTVDDTQSLGALGVRKFETASYLRQGRIAYRESPNAVGFYEYDRWAADPGITVTTAFIEALRSSGLFSLVGPYSGHDKPDYLLTGRLERLDEIDYGGGVQVEVKISAQLINLRTASTVWTGSASHASRVETRTMDSVVAEMSRGVEKCIDQLMASMEHERAAAALSTPRESPPR
jgi:uncharacterized lipoprotein YmbA